ncbi:MAG: GIY-YIG nuclease family protein [Candidatus Hodarchaeota archaeon]
MSINIPKNEIQEYKRSGVYLFLDLDDHYLYAGRSGNIYQRLGDHFVAHNSSIVADGTIDLFEIKRVFVWFMDSTEDTKKKEEELLTIFRPRMNLAARDQRKREEESSVEKQRDFLENAGRILEVKWPSGVDRKNNFVRAKRKAAHLALILEKTELSQKDTEKFRTQLSLHLEDLNRLVGKILQTMEKPS